MDGLDLRILGCLKENARANATEIGSRINLSTSAVIERIRKLESSGAIRQYTLVLDPELEGRLTAFIHVRLEHPKYYEDFVQAVKTLAMQSAGWNERISPELYHSGRRAGNPPRWRG